MASKPASGGYLRYRKSNAIFVTEEDVDDPPRAESYESISTLASFLEIVKQGEYKFHAKNRRFSFNFDVDITDKLVEVERKLMDEKDQFRDEFDENETA